ncbi:hypothetical protein SNE40_003925 [Patella caerulea]|uniref:Poly [ADP-ribose] polymerase n=1 Tax=Patella caerulea TaxID=87958 RepID=A0AAN8KCH8_PATCE
MEEIKHQVLTDLTDVFPQLPESLLLEVIVDTIEPDKPFEPARNTLVQSCIDQLLDTSRFLSSNGDSQQNNNKSLSSMPEDGKTFPVVDLDQSDNANHLICDSDNMFDFDLTSPSAYSSDSFSHPLVALGLDRNIISAAAKNSDISITPSSNVGPQQANGSLTIPGVTDTNTTLVKGSSESCINKSISAENKLASSQSLTTNSSKTSNSVRLSSSPTSELHVPKTSSQSTYAEETSKKSDNSVNLTSRVTTSRPTANKASAICQNLVQNCVDRTPSSTATSNSLDVTTRKQTVKSTNNTSAIGQNLVQNCVDRMPSSTVTPNPLNVTTGSPTVQNLNQTSAVSLTIEPNCVSPPPSSKPFNVKTSRTTIQDTNHNSPVRLDPIHNRIDPSTSSNLTLNPLILTTSEKTPCHNLGPSPSIKSSKVTVINISDDEDKNSSITTLNGESSIPPIKQNSQQRNTNVIKNVVQGHLRNEDKKSSKEDVAVMNLAEEEGDEEIHSSLQTVLDIFPDADRNWVENQLQAIKTQDPTNYTEVVCNTMFDSPYKKHRAIEMDNNLPLISPPKKHTAKTKHLDKVVASCSTLDSSRQTLNTTMSLEINRKRKADEDTVLEEHSSVKYVKKEDETVIVTNQDVHETGSSTPMDCDASNATTDQDCCACESCHQFYNLSKLGQCCEGHLLCQKCIWKEIKLLLDLNFKKSQIDCKVKDCTSFMSIGEVRRIVSGEIMELFNDRLEKENIITINNLENIVRCPECGFTAELLQVEKEFHCGNPDCMLSSCRYCKKSWNDDSHTHCTALLTLVDKTDGTSCPKYWKNIEEKTDKDFFILPLEKESEEYRAVKNLMLATMSQTMIKSIYRIQNNKLWEKYYLSRKHISDDFGAQKLNERHLFHGTNPQNIQQICQQGFDWRLSGKQVGAAYGEGAYFAVTAIYSDRLTQPISDKLDVMKSLSFGHFIPLTQKSATVVKQNDTSSHNPTNDKTPTDHMTPVNNTPSSMGQTPGNHFGQTPGNHFGPVSFLTSHLPPLSAAQSPYQPNNKFGLPSSLASRFNYFAQQSTFGGSPSMGGKVKLMFMARVVCGRPFQGSKGIRRPPPDETDSKKRLYNSAVNYLGRPDMFIIFDSSQCYPEYVIEYYC